MKIHFDTELKEIKQKLFKMGSLVEEALFNASDALFKRDSNKAEEVIKKDQDINIYEIEIDQMGNELIALYSPAAVDLRLISMVLRMTSDLERIGDQCVNIAQQVLVINQSPQLKPYEELPKMTEKAREMVSGALSSFADRDADKAKIILESDDVIDKLNYKIYEDLQQIMETDVKYIRAGVALIMVAHNLERIGDLATNIAEDVIYLNRGVDVRHHIRERRE